jgi:ferredoxin
VALLFRRLPANAEGDLFVDDHCIACDTCRQLAPETFGGGEDELSFVTRQPSDPASRHRALLALVSCPVAAIGSASKAGITDAACALPIEHAPAVLRCGYAAESSFGASSWLLLRPDGNVMVDSPRFAGPLVKRVRALGGIRFLFLTHRDDVADHARWRGEFGCERILHTRDAGRGTRDVERRLEGDEPVALASDLLAVPVPGHTAGSTVLLAGGGHEAGPPGPPAHSGAGSSACPFARIRPVPLHRRSPLGGGRRTPARFPRRVLVRLEAAGALDGPPGNAGVRARAAGPRPALARPLAGGRAASGARAGRADARRSVNRGPHNPKCAGASPFQEQ